MFFKRREERFTKALCISVNNASNITNCVMHFRGQPRIFAVLQIHLLPDALTQQKNRDARFNEY